jgi:hypothetical protein
MAVDGLAIAQTHLAGRQASIGADDKKAGALRRLLSPKQPTMRCPPNQRSTACFGLQAPRLTAEKPTAAILGRRKGRLVQIIASFSSGLRDVANFLIPIHQRSE